MCVGINIDFTAIVSVIAMSVVGCNEVGMYQACVPAAGAGAGVGADPKSSKSMSAAPAPASGLAELFFERFFFECFFFFFLS